MQSTSLQEICTLFGQPVAGNPTQYMLEKAFAQLGLDWRYLTLDVEPGDLGDAVRGMRAMGFRGGNVTSPHKVAVVEYLDRLSDAAAMMGAVNCIVREGRILIGENTDGKGFLESLAEITSPAGKKIAILGAGGAARAIAVELALAGAQEIRVVNRGPERGQALADLLNQKTSTPAVYLPWEGDFAVPSDMDVLIQATTVGLGDAQARVNVLWDQAAAGLIVADVIASPPQTALLREARQRGHTTLDGLGMIVNQAAIGLKLWSGLAADKGLLREAAEEYLEV